MDLDDIKRGLRAEIKKRENEQYATFQCNVRQMCKDVLAKLEEQESVIADKDEQLRHSNYKRCLAMAEWCEATALWCYQAANTLPEGFHATLYGKPVMIEPDRLFKRFVRLNNWSKFWRKLAKKFKEA